MCNHVKSNKKKKKEKKNLENVFRAFQSSIQIQQCSLMHLVYSYLHNSTCIQVYIYNYPYNVKQIFYHCFSTSSSSFLKLKNLNQIYLLSGLCLKKNFLKKFIPWGINSCIYSDLNYILCNFVYTKLPDSICLIS